MELRMVEIVSLPFILIKFGNEFFLIRLMTHNIMTKSFFCLSDVVITLRNYPRGESSRDVTVLNIVRLILQTEFSDVRFDSPLIYNNLIAPDITIRQTAINGPEVAGHSSTEHSNQAETSTETSKISDIDEEDRPVPQVSATVEDSEEEPSRSSRRRRRKRKHKAAPRFFNSSSENERHSRPLNRKRKQKHSVQARDSELPGFSRTRKELAGRKIMYGKGWPRKRKENATKHIDATNKDAEEETITGLLKTRRKTYKRPSQHGNSPVEEPVPGPSGKNTGLLKKEGKHFQFNAKPPSKDSKASAKEPLTGKKKRKRPRKDDKNSTKQPDASTTDSEESQLKRLRKRKKKDKGNK